MEEYCQSVNEYLGRGTQFWLWPAVRISGRLWFSNVYWYLIYTLARNHENTQFRELLGDVHTCRATEAMNKKVKLFCTFLGGEKHALSAWRTWQSLWMVGGVAYSKIQSRAWVLLCHALLWEVRLCSTLTNGCCDLQWLKSDLHFWRTN